MSLDRSTSKGKKAAAGSTESNAEVQLIGSGALLALRPPRTLSESGPKGYGYETRSALGRGFPQSLPPKCRLSFGSVVRPPRPEEASVFCIPRNAKEEEQHAAEVAATALLSALGTASTQNSATPFRRSASETRRPGALRALALAAEDVVSGSRPSSRK
eukprot:TRINITY_DN2711_c0_g2_i1.p1 TRINITY_DN2711_c0_g2~~TRINITY_DN2711_c0_g2_i1.p1  ORF type:complete len:159 (+),score=17.90 TRINITY_DN2711_c0_g2_i1:100-576(+)